MTPKECANLMGASHYRLDDAQVNKSLFGFGDAVVVPVVEWLGKHYLRPLVTGSWLSQQEPHSEQHPLFELEGSRHG